jgi:lipopolysaccharide export system protein LptA
MIKHIVTIFLISCFSITPLLGKNGEMQLFNFSGKSKNNERVSTEITSDELKILTNEDKIIFIKNVVVDDQSMIIHCDKMIVYLTKKSSSKKKKKTGSLSGLTGGGSSGKKLDKIECIGNVVIIRKLYDKKELEVGEQRGTADYVTYFPDTGKSVLTGSPVLSRGTDSLKAKKSIIIYKNSGTITTVGRIKIITYPKTKN